MIASCLGLSGYAQAADFQWDPGHTPTTPSGGVGTWNTTTSDWSNGIADSAWVNASNTAIFGGATGGLVTINTGATGVTVGGLTFNATTDTSTYTIAGGASELLTLNSGTIITTNADAAISAVLAGSNGFTKAGSGKLTLSGNNTGLSGAVLVNAGTLSAAIATGANPFGSGAINLAGGTLDLTPTATNTTGIQGRVFTLGATQNDTANINFGLNAGSVRSDTTINIANGTSVAANTAIQWLGKIKITSGGSYQFLTTSDDGSRVFIDGVLVLNNDGGKGTGTFNGGISVNLDAGYHEIRVDYDNGTGNSGVTLNYKGPDTANASVLVPSSVLFRAESMTTAAASTAVIVGSGIGNALNVSGTSGLSLNGTDYTQVQFGNASLATGSTLNVTTGGALGKGVAAAGTFTLGSGTAGTATLNSAADFYVDGAAGDGGVAMTLAKLGTGRLVFGQTAVANTLGSTSTLDIQAGTLTLVGSSETGAFNPIGSAKIKLNGGNLVLDTKIGGATYANAIDVTANATIQDVATASTTTLSGPISIPTGNTLTLDALAGGNPASSLGATLRLSARSPGRAT
ncbi:MAG: PA14 domain-containing protein [Pirellulales bacterium]